MCHNVQEGSASMDIHTQQLRHFMELAKCLNFTRAAMNLYIAQPALSQQIADLEKQLGVTLFERTSRSVTLTPAGEILQKACPEILNRINSVQQQLLSAQAGLRGSLKIGYLSAFQSTLPKLVQKYRDLYPDVAVELFLGSIKETRTALRSQDADIIFTAVHPEMREEDNTLTRRTLWQEGMCLVMRRDHPFALSGGRDYALLHDSVFSLLDDETVPGFQRLVQNICAETGIPLNHVTTSKSWGPIGIQMETGMAVSIFSTHDSEQFCAYHKELVSFPIRDNCLTFCSVWNPKSKNAALPLFLDILDSMLDSTAG